MEDHVQIDRRLLKKMWKYPEFRLHVQRFLCVRRIQHIQHRIRLLEDTVIRLEEQEDQDLQPLKNMAHVDLDPDEWESVVSSFDTRTIKNIKAPSNNFFVRLLQELL